MLVKSSLLIIFIVSGCQIKREITNNKLDSKIDTWHQKDKTTDFVYGLSLEKWFTENKKLNNNEIVVATIDTQIDLNHEDLQGQIWINKKEIANNEIDDDKNGYVDDINGWNFIGKPNGGYFRYWNFEYTRIVANKNYDSDEFNRAKLKYDSYKNAYQNGFDALGVLNDNYNKIHDTLKYFFPKEDYDKNKVDSLYQLKKSNDHDFTTKTKNKETDLGSLLFYKLMLYKYGNETKKSLEQDLVQYDSIINKNLNINYNDRKFIGDNPDKLEKGYGNNKLNVNTFQLSHNTAVSSIIAANRNNTIGTKGFHQNIKIMPLSISTSGDEHDKDIAMAIYYAVDNGAKVVNMSFGKEFSLNQKWVSEAFKYAEEHNVLLVHGSGNNGFDVDENPYYPSDVDYLRNKETEIVQNFINVGSISKRTDSTMLSSFSNYGKNNVDIFAPGEEIYVAQPNDKYGFDSGTSLAGPMVSGTVALIWLYYPNLTVQEVKKCILESGTTIDKNVIKPGTQAEMVHFSELCKSGKTLNTYNAMKMAEAISKLKKKNN